uniref:RimK-like ATPgrasp N-terminal domain-containing protein n=2 Tax=Geoglobus ahangari TaxID=113653 RepID=A0A7C4W4D0_9EURY
MILVGEGEDLEPPDSFMKRRVSGKVLNLLGDYRYLTKGYYVSLHAEENGCEVFPPVKNALDAYRAPLFISILRKLGFETPEFEIVCNPKPEACVLLPLNPFSKNSAKVVKNSYQYLKAFRSLSMNRYPVVQVKAEKIEIVDMYLTKTNKEEYSFVAETLFRTLKIPLGKVFFEVNGEKVKPFYFAPLEKDEINFELIFEVLNNENSLFC